MGYTIWPDGPTGDALSEVNEERHRQNELHRTGVFSRTVHRSDIEFSNAEKLVVLVEEVGEVARHLADFQNGAPLGTKELRKELIEVAAVAVAWAEALR